MISEAPPTPPGIGVGMHTFARTDEDRVEHPRPELCKHRSSSRIFAEGVL
jgi:hypothetical protein